MKMEISNSYDINAEFQHVYTTNFIIDDSEECHRMSELNLKRYDRVFYVIDRNVFEIYKNIIIKRAGVELKKLFFHLVEPTEQTKSLQYYPKLVKFLSDNNAGRYDAVVAVGGGIVIDLVGFTVSSYMRGLPFFVIATTLIGQTDASTAGKTCLNADNSKNLLGTFYYPKIVYNNIKFLETCSKRITRQGLSEAFKYSLLTDGKLLLPIIEFNNKPFELAIMREIVTTTIHARIQIRKIDPLASNLGHTFGHALEKYYNYQILHGDAILIGIIMANYYAVEKSLMSQEECNSIFSLIKQAHLNIWIDRKLDVKKLISYMRKDKKSSADKMHLVLLNGIGRPYKGQTPFFETDYVDVEKYLINFMNEYEYQCDNYIRLVQKEVLE